MPTSFKERSRTVNSRISTPYSANLAGLVVAISSSTISSAHFASESRIGLASESLLRLISEFEPGASAFLFERQLNKPVDKLRQREVRRFPQLRVHADSRKAWNRIHFVDEALAQIGAHEKIHSSHTTQAEYFERGCGKSTHP